VRRLTDIGSDETEYQKIFVYFEIRAKLPLISAVIEVTNGGKTPDPFCSLLNMPPPSNDRIQSLRPVAVELASLATGRVTPVASVNPARQNTMVSDPSPSVINLVNQSDKPNFGEGVYSSVSDPTRPGSLASEPSKDWTIKLPKAEETKPVPEPPIYRVLIDHLKSLWSASASAVQVQQQVKNQTETLPSAQVPQGALSTQVFTYSPTKINKTEKTQT
jgi:hypothetical protein